MLTILSQSVGALTSAETREELREALSHATQALGFATFNVSLNKRHAVEFMETPTLSTWSDEELEHYSREGWGSRDPLLQCAAAASAPFLWRAADWENSGYLDYAALLRFQGVVGGATIPLESRDGRVSAMTLLSVSDQPLTEDALHAARILAHLAQARVSAVCETIQPRNAGLRSLKQLSAHQLEILSWVAKGKTNAEIAVIMDSKRRTIDYHLQEIRNKLQVTSRAQAAAMYAAADPLAPPRRRRTKP